MQSPKRASETARAARAGRVRRIRCLAGLMSLTLGFSKNAAAEETAGPCANPRIHVDEPLPAAWVDAVSRLCRSFGEDGAAAPGARLHIHIQGEGDDALVVEAT